MDEKMTTPIGCMAALLAEMTERAMEAERQRDAAKEDAGNWYQHYLSKVEQLKAAEAKQAALIEENKGLRDTIAEHIGNM